MLRLHRFLPFTKAEGPGNRACLWVQGCPIRCPGCFNPGTWSKKGGEEVPVETIAGRILDAPDIEGVTFLGGEPFEQAEALAELGGAVQAHGLSVMTFTGYTLEEIEGRSRPGWRELLSVTDLLLDGPYVKSLTDTSRPWVGSSNQRYHFLTSRYRHLEGQLENLPNRIEVCLQPDGRVLVNGLASAELLGDLVDGMTGGISVLTTRSPRPLG
jgi:anaerobic ribonucleoside-triphosphate reductase activating protein